MSSVVCFTIIFFFTNFADIFSIFQYLTSYLSKSLFLVKWHPTRVEFCRLCYLKMPPITQSSWVFCYSKWKPARYWPTHNNVQNVSIPISISIFLHSLNWESANAQLMCGDIFKFSFASERFAKSIVILSMAKRDDGTCY